MKVRVLYNNDSTVSVIHPAPKSRREDESEADWLKRVFDKATPKAAEYDDIEASELPQNREDRAAWEGMKGQGVYVNTKKAQILRDIKLQENEIKLRIAEIQRVQAIKELKEEGKLPTDFESQQSTKES